MIELEQLTRCYGNRTAVNKLDLRIEPGEVFAFLGPNGAGKTTTIKMMVGLLEPTSGGLRLGGINAVADRRQANRLIGYVPDQIFLYEKLTGREFLRFVGGIHGLGGDLIEERIAEVTRKFELQEFIDELAESYSHGMKQRMAFGAALVHRPPILIVDEPMVGLDPRSMRLVKDLLRSEAHAGAAVFMSTHTLNVAEEIADRIGIIEKGVLRFLGTVTELRRKLSSDQSNLENLYLTLTSANGGEI